MFARKTTLILGAGASCELGLPLGRSLQAKIQRQLHRELETLKRANVRQLLPSDAPIAVALHRRSHEHGAIRTAFHKLADGIVEGPSIDTFLFNNAHDPLMIEAGKAAIIHEILISERNSFPIEANAARQHFDSEKSRSGKSHNDDQLAWDTYAIQNSYLGIVWDELCQDHNLSNVDAAFKNLSVINFNYDRSLEYVLHRKLLRTFPDIQKTSADRIINSMDVIRPYGSPHGSEPYTEASLPYGTEDFRNLHSYVDNIRTYTEAIDENTERSIKALVQKSQTIVVLGFGFHKQNLDLISCDAGQSKNVYFSALGLSDEDMTAYRHELASRMARIAPQGAPYVDMIRATHQTCVGTLSTFRHGIFRA